MAALLVSVISFGQNGLNFDGVNDHLVTTNPGPVGNTSRTVELWFKLGSLTPTTQKVLVDWGAMTPNGSRFTLNILSNRLRIEVGGNGANGTTTLTTGVWNHVATVYDAATSTHTLYLNGVQEFSGPLTVAVNTLSTNPIQVGRRNDGINFFT